MNKLLITAIGIVLLALAGNVRADTYFSMGNSDFYFEVYRGGSYEYVATPYTYVYDGYYYFDYPFRVYDVGTYHYYNAGWYGLDTYWSSPNTYCATCYTYYSPSYYYYDGYWSYSPNWVYTYGPGYYGAYFLAPGQATLVGQHYQPKQEASCRQATISTEPVTVEAGGKKAVTFYINNYSRMYLDVAAVSVTTDAPGVRTANVEFDNVVMDYSAGRMEFDLIADSGLETDVADARVEVTGTFRDGTYCGSGTIGEDFSVSVSGEQKLGNQNVTRYNYGQGTAGSISYTQAKGTQQAWREVMPSEGRDYAGHESYGGQQNRHRGRDYDDGARRDDSRVVETYYGTAQLQEQDCSGLNIPAQNISVGAGDSITKYFTIKNFSPEDFAIDSMEASEYSPDFSIAVSRDNTRVYAGETGALKVKVYGDKAEQDSTGTAYLKVRGHYASGLSCEVLSDNFYVRVNGSDKSSLNDVKLRAPQGIDAEGTSAFLLFGLDNPSNRELVVRVYSGEVSVSPSEFTFAPKTTGNRTVALNGVGRNEAKVYISVEADGSQVLNRYVVVRKVKEAAVPAESEGATTGAPAEGTGRATGSTGGLVSAGFSFLADNAVTLGLLVLLILIGLEIMRR